MGLDLGALSKEIQDVFPQALTADRDEVALTLQVTADAAAVSDRTGTQLVCHAHLGRADGLKAVDTVHGHLEGTVCAWDGPLVHRHPLALAGMLEAEDQPRLRRRWAACAQLSEALTREQQRRAAAGDDQARLLLPFALHSRFVLLSQPFRTGDVEEAAELYGGVSWLAFAARRARQMWAEVLLAAHDHPHVAVWPPDIVEREVRRILYVTDRRCGRHPLSLPPAAPADDRRTDDADTDGDGKVGDAAEDRFRVDVVAGFLLPRFMLADTWRVVGGLHGTSRWHVLAAAAVMAAAAAAVVAVAAVVGADQRWLLGAPGAVAAAGLGWAVWRGGEGVAHLAVLRLPAGTAIGLSVLLAADSRWLVGGGGAAAGLVLAAATAAYLWFEAANHGVQPRRALGRGLLVGAVGIVHGLLTAGVVLAYLAPMVEPAGRLRRFAADHTLDGLLLGALGGLALGVFLQVLWDEQPVTAPLARLRRTAGR